jgi:HEPN domain-containing protein
MNDPQPTEVVQLWLQRARSDLALGKAALRTPGVLPEDACFHAQQCAIRMASLEDDGRCAEKALKGLLSSAEIPFPRTHALEVLLDLLKAHGVAVPNSVDEAFTLSQYSVQTRYPGDWEPVTKIEAKQALQRASYVLAWVETQVS